MRRRQHLALLSCLGLAAASIAVGAAGASAGPTALRGTATRTDVGTGHPAMLSRDVIRNLTRLTPVGPAPATERMQVIVAIRNPNDAAAKAYLHRISDPADPLYQHFLSPATYGQLFGVSKDQTRDVVARLSAGGLRVDDVTAGGDAITAIGTVAAVQKTFTVSEMRYVSNGYDFVANTTGPTVWSADGVFTVIGLDTLQRYFTPGQMTKLSGMAATVPATHVLPIDTTVYDLRKLYDQPAAHTGAGQGLTVIGEGNPAVPLSDLSIFEKTYGLPKVTTTVNCVDKNAAGKPDCGTDTAGNGEWDIDFQASTGLAPGVQNLTIDFSKSLGDSDLDHAFLRWIDDPHGTRQASASEGVCEQNPLNPVTDTGTPINSNETEGTGEALGNDQEPVLDTHFLQAALEGRTMFASTGDTGNTCGALIVGPIGAGNGVIYNGAPDSVDYPAASAYVTAVGGTEIYPDHTSSTFAGCATDKATGGKYGASTVSYPACTEFGWPYSGGGISQYIAEGDYAATDGVTKVPCLASPDGSMGNTGKNCRSTPDIAAQSGGLTDAMLIISDGQEGFGAGTSLSAPLWQGMWAGVQSAAPTTAGFGFADETIYRLATKAASYARDFHDVTIGANPLPATTGYDNVTGWGTPDLAHLTADARAEGPVRVAGLTIHATTALAVGSGHGSGELAFTGLSALVPIAAVALLALGGAGWAARRRLG